MKRKSISKSVRFEVFKRDSFKCQYCGASAPDVLLHVDHIEPISRGGSQSDIVNLITSCEACNSGKGAVRLSDESAVRKKKAQLDELQERRSQIEMMAEWQRGLVDLADVGAEECVKLWERIVTGYHLSERGRKSIRDFIARFGVKEVMDAIQISRRYLDAGPDGRPTPESVELSIKKIGGICVISQRSKADPYLQEVYRIKGRICRACPSIFDSRVLADIQGLRESGVPFDAIRQRLGRVEKWWEYYEAIGDLNTGARP